MNAFIQNIVQANARLLANAAECYHYNFSAKDFQKEYKKIVDSVPKLRISDIKTLDDLEALGMTYKKNDVYLIPLRLIAFFDPEEYVLCFIDKSRKKVKDIDLDSRSGYLGYGIPNNYRG